MKCFSCPQPYHESTGHYHREWDVVICETCYKSFLRWMRGHVQRPWGGHLFYTHAETSVKPGCAPSTNFTRYHRLSGPMQEVKRKKREPNPDVVQVVLVTNQPENIVMVSELWVEAP